MGDSFVKKSFNFPSDSNTKDLFFDPNASPSSINQNVRFEYPEISDVDALIIANGDDFSNFGSSSKANDNSFVSGDVPNFDSFDSEGPVLLEPTKKELYGEGYRGSRIFRRGSRKNKR